MGDSHTCTHGAFGAFAAGVGTTDLEVGILKGVCAFRKPASILVNLQGTLPEGVYSKDVILHLIGILGVNGATDRVIEFRGPVVDAMSMDARMTLTNMAIEAGGTCGICLPDQTTVEYLWPFIKDDYANQAAALEDFRRWHSDADAVYERVLDLDVSNLEPQVTYDYKPDCVKPVGELAGTRIDQVYIGTCTNGRLEDLRQGGGNPQGAHHCPDGARYPVAGNAENFPGGSGRGTDCHFHGCRVLRHQSDLRRLSWHELRGVGAR